MTARTLRFSLTRPKVVLPALLGAGLLLANVSLFWGSALVAFALWQSLRIGGAPRLDDLLRLREAKKQHRIDRLLTDAERREIITIDEYADKLRHAGADPTLCEEILSQAWEIVRSAGNADAGDELRTFRLTLPPLGTSGTVATPPLGQRIYRELNLLHATQKEMESMCGDNASPLVTREVA
jgi:hypothetical protein